MPHLIVESSPGVIENKPALLTDLVDRFSEFDTITSSDVKARIYEPQNYLLGAGGKANFLHLIINILEGRELELRKKMADTLHHILISHVIVQDVNVTVELREMDRSTYRK